MKTKNFMLLAALLIANAAFAGNDPTASPDTTTVEIIKDKVIVVERRDDDSRSEVTTYTRARYCEKTEMHWNFMFDIGMNSYGKRNVFTGSEGGTDFLGLTSKSVNVGVYPWIGSVRLNPAQTLLLNTGIGFDWGNYRFEHGWSIANVDGQTVPTDKYRTPEGQSLVEKSKLMTLYMNVPLMLRWNIPLSTSSADRIHLAAGVIGGLKLGSHTKVKYDEGGKHKEHDSYNLNLLRYDLTFRAGYGPVGVYFNYQMTPMFEDGHGPKLYPYSVGLSFGF